MGVFIRGYATGSAWPRVTRTVVVPASELPLTLEEAKNFSRVPHDGEDAVLLMLLGASTKRVEADTGLALMTQTLDLTFDGFPSSTTWPLPVEPVQSVTSIISTDTDGDPQTMSAADYIVLGNRIGLADEASWPTDLRKFTPVTVRVVAGYLSAELVPDDLKVAVALVFGWLVENREPAKWEREVYEGWVNNHKRELVA